MTIKPLTVRRKGAAAMTGEGTTKIDELLALGKLDGRKSGKNLLITVEVDREIHRIVAARRVEGAEAFDWCPPSERTRTRPALAQAIAQCTARQVLNLTTTPAWVPALNCASWKPAQKPPQRRRPEMPNTTVYVLMMQNGDELTDVRVYSSRDAAENAIRLVAERDQAISQLTWPRRRSRSKTASR